MTQSEFLELEEEVGKLAARLMGIPNAEFPENKQLLLDLRKGASLTDAMAALQLSARMDAAETALKKMIALVTEMAQSQSAGTEVSWNASTQNTLN